MSQSPHPELPPDSLQFHYVVTYDTATGTWAMEADTEPYFPQGNVWDGKNWTQLSEDDPLYEVDDLLYDQLASFLPPSE